jgi:hypothetical protein
MSDAATTADPAIYVLMHLPKTGGTTVNAHLAEHLGFDEGFAHLGPWGNQARSEIDMPHPDEWPDEKLSRLRAISGHRVHGSIHHLIGDREVRYYTFFRDSRVEDPPPFWEWYEAREKDPQFNWCRHRLGVERFGEVISGLNEFWFVGITERLDRDLPHIFEAIGVPAEFASRRTTGGGDDLADVWPPIDDVVIRRHQKRTPDVRDRVNAEHKLDARLHKYARRRARTLRERYGWDES